MPISLAVARTCTRAPARPATMADKIGNCFACSRQRLRISARQRLIPLYRVHRRLVELAAVVARKFKLSGVWARPGATLPRPALSGLDQVPVVAAAPP